VSVIRRGDWKDAARLEVGVEPTALALTGDGKRLYVVSSTARDTADVGVLTAFDTATLARLWELAVGHEPRGLALLNGDKAMVSLFKDGDVALVDLQEPKVLKSGTAVNDQLNRLPVQSKEHLVDPMGAKVRGASALAASPDGKWVYAAANLSSSGIVSTQDPSQGEVMTDGGFVDFPSSKGGSGYGGGSCGAPSISTPALLSFDTNATPVVDDLSNCHSDTTDVPPTVMTSGSDFQPLQGPRAAVVDASGQFAFVVHHDSNNVAVVPTSKRGFATSGGFGGRRFGPSVQTVVGVGAGPTGIALAKDGTRAWVYNALDHSLSKLETQNGFVGASRTVPLGQDVLAPDVAAGRRLFFNATDTRMTTVGLSCGTCHVDGREDGHVWNFTTGPRQTPTLAGRKLQQTLPLHWDGEFKDMTDLSHAITGRMGGSGISNDMAQQISAYLETLPSPENPMRKAERTPAQARGAQVFTKANCQSCHAGEALTNNGFADVGTRNQVGPVQDAPGLSLNTPSLIGLARTAPYLHDGSALTLKDRLVRGKADDRHGSTAQLSDAEMNDLVAYLQSL
jgi:cytochrome c peroxidase